MHLLVVPTLPSAWEDRKMNKAIVLNFAHPITGEQLAKIAELTGREVEVMNIRCQLDFNRSVADQARELVDAAGLDPVAFQTEAIVVNPPGMSSAAGPVLAELHGRMGHFPTTLVLRRVDGTTPPQFEVGEIIDLQAVRDEARKRR